MARRLRHPAACTDRHAVRRFSQCVCCAACASVAMACLLCQGTAWARLQHTEGGGVSTISSRAQEGPSRISGCVSPPSMGPKMEVAHGSLLGRGGGVCDREVMVNDDAGATMMSLWRHRGVTGSRSDVVSFTTDCPRRVPISSMLSTQSSGCHKKAVFSGSGAVQQFVWIRETA